MSTTAAASAPRMFHGQILRAAGSVAAAGLLVKLAALIKDSTIAAAFGRSDAMDAFLAAFLIPNLLINLLAESMNQVLIPVLIRVRLRQGQEHAQRLFSNATLSLSCFLTCIAVILGVTARRFLPFVTGGFPAEKLELSIRLFRELIPVIVLGGLASNLAAVANTMNSFALPALIPVVIPLSVIAGTCAFRTQLGIWALVVSTVFGFGAQAALSGWVMQERGYCLRLRWYSGDRSTWEVARLYGPILVSSAVASGGLVADQAFAALLPAGSVSSLVFGGKFVSVLVTLLAGSLSTAITPCLSSIVASADWSTCRLVLRVWAGRMALISVPLMGLLMVFSRPLVRMTLQHGSFRAEDTSQVALVLVMYAIQLPLFVVSRVYYRFLLAMCRTDLILYCGGINLVLDVALDYLLMRRMGVAGIALATSIWTATTLALMAFWSYRLLDEAERKAAAKQ